VHLARLLRIGEIHPVAVPSAEQDAARDLVRTREDCRGDLMRARHRLSKLLLRHGLVYTGGNAWTGPHDVWLRRQRFANPATMAAFESNYETVLAVTARRDRLDKAITAMAADSEFTPMVHRLGCLRGIATLTGFVLAVEIGDWTRFTGNSIGSFVGLVPRESSSGTSRAQASITEPATPTSAGCSSRLPGTTSHATCPATRCATGGSWPRLRPELVGTPATARLHARWVSFNLRRKKAAIADVAVARELAGWCWSQAVLE
jgi:transposase